MSESDGYLVTGPLDVTITGGEDITRLYRSVRVVCPDLPTLESALDELKNSGSLEIKKTKRHIREARSKSPPGYRGALLQVEWRNESVALQLNTVQQTRWLIWAGEAFFSEDASLDTKTAREYMLAVSDYLYAVDTGNGEAEEPEASAFGLPETVDLYAPPPDYVIQGYRNYLNFLNDHKEIKTDFARGVVAFIPTDSLLDAMITGAPKEAFPNKEAPMLQREYRKFFYRGGQVRVMQTLNKAGFDTLGAGEYFFAVGLSGKIRFARELSRQEVARIEAETGGEVPRANHAFLFPGEPVLTAGAFFIEGDNKPHLARVNAQSGHYFYSNVSSTIRNDVTALSDYYLLTLGHFFRALDDLGIAYSNVLISKLW